MRQVRLEPAAPRSRIKHSTTEPLRSGNFDSKFWFIKKSKGGLAFLFKAMRVQNYPLKYLLLLSLFVLLKKLERTASALKFGKLHNFT